jgi:putative transposase
MPRGARILLDNACYHVVNRGNQKQHIFLEHSDYAKYLELIGHYKRRYCFKLFGYCLMPNHVHAIVQPKEAKDISIFMQCLTQTYTNWFNAKYKKVGHLWQGRYKNMIILKDEYFLECVSYIEKNPVRAGIVSSPSEYLWSSYRDRTLGNKVGLLDLPDTT